MKTPLLQLICYSLTKFLLKICSKFNIDLVVFFFLYNGHLHHKNNIKTLGFFLNGTDTFDQKFNLHKLFGFFLFF